MFYKILVFGGIAVTAVLVVENMVVSTQAFLFVDRNSTTGMLAIVSTLVGIAIGYGFFGMMHDNREIESDDIDF
ncbi:hypothetical protein MK079_03535 [Candidatus Gracilibacteria bacterium]|nr:hypothetical protein [Candidatus Gracilibacteria bacterium]